KNVTYPTDGKLAMKMIHHLHKIAKAEGIQLRRTYVKPVFSGGPITEALSRTQNTNSVPGERAL
ncbi:MAG: hypothetical protein PHH65_09100, partial [Eubacteriales bacterium]|nr:hypothetical protein [Eubacteriales bacterium]